ncbi:bifunctional DNA primase/polymerase [Microbacterium sp. 18062]|uniref:bifunctional DNA primase/polymerase n=1 Tax=Microbacterium sp. 18062 TaxID=2681410 RepID=UPI00135BFAB4|nr:bifunctional DNA primase/polymerase [Microbacterium sp. 18062]
MIQALQETLSAVGAHRGTMRDAALMYAAAGLDVFPCAPGGKQPLTTRGYRDATTGARRIRGWWAWQPKANIGIATGHGLDVLDIDVHAGGDGYAVLERLHRTGMVTGALAAVRTPSGGTHLYFPSEADRPQQTWSRGTSHVDFRGTDGYVLAPPSTVIDRGRRAGYTILTLNTEPRPVDGDRIRELLTPIRPRVTVTTALAGSAPAESERLTHWLGAAVEGNRNASLFWAACRLAEHGIDEQGIHDLLDRPALGVGLGAREIDATIRSAWRTVQLTPAADAGGRSAGPVPGAVRR